MLIQAGHADAYKDVKVTFISGHNPELFIKSDDGQVLERIDLSRMSTDAIHKLMITNLVGITLLSFVDALNTLF
jgi:hypothetical protein